ncbi:MAG: pentapeptide repeat-containing protein, partial [Planctomycetota bacterium]
MRHAKKSRSLSGANFTAANLTRVILIRANLSGAAHHRNLARLGQSIV